MVGNKRRCSNWNFAAGLNHPVSHMRRRKRNAGTPGAAAHDAGVVIDRGEPIIEVQLERLAIALGRVTRVLPMKRATGAFR